MSMPSLLSLLLSSVSSLMRGFLFASSWYPSYILIDVGSYSLISSPFQSRLMPILDDPPNCVLELDGLLNELLVVVVEGILIFGSSLWLSSRGLLMDGLGLLISWYWLIILSLRSFNLPSTLFLHASVWLCAGRPSRAILHPKHPDVNPSLIKPELWISNRLGLGSSSVYIPLAGVLIGPSSGMQRLGLIATSPVRPGVGSQGGL